MKGKIDKRNIKREKVGRGGTYRGKILKYKKIKKDLT